MPGDNQRAASIHSVASNSSIASGVSLTRRSRTRTRAKTLTGGSADGRVGAEIIGPSQLPYLDKPLVNEPIVDTYAPDSSAGMHVAMPPPRPPRSSQRPEISESQTSNAVLDEDQPKDLDQNETSLPVGGSTSSHGDDPMSVQHILTANSPPSADTHESSVVSARVSVPTNIRDSVLTQQSVSSSSLYPPSTSTASGTESTSPRSIGDQDEHYGGSSFEPEIDEVQDFDGDDVSYRLRLLMKNNYFLPPAHSKPSASDFAYSTLNAPKRPTAPTFLDLFRVGRSKPKPLTPSSPPESGAPILRTTSDSTTASGYIPPPQSRSLPTTPLSSRPIPTHDRSGRVVVVREKMNDLVGAAKQAEQEMKSRSGRRDQGSQRGPVDTIDDVIDPTDAVDLPPPSAGYPFAVQASALHGLGVEDSVGAAVLAEHLPPPNSPGLSLLTPEEYAWRKALLHEAVGHSLQNSPAMSISSPSPVATTSLDSSHSTDPGAPSRAVSMKRMLGQRIIAQPLIEQDEESPTPSPRLRTMKSRGLGSLDTHDLPRPPSYLPSRAETPSAPPTPLAPPPRRQIINPLYSLSQTDLSQVPEPRASMSSSKGLRRAVSSPRLSDAYESEVRATIPMTPPPLPDFKSRTSSRSCLSSFETNRAVASMATTTDSHYSEEEQALPRDSTTLSIPTTNRPSSEYSQPSPTASAFQDALDYSYYSSSPNPRRRDENTSTPSKASNASPAPRYSTMSPPPRVSSSLANVVLSPPPRSTSLPQKLLITRLSTSTGRSPSSSDADHYPIQPASAPEIPTSFPVSGRRGLTMPLSLQIPNYNIPLTVRSAPPPASPIAFFDHIQTHPNAMDDLDSSSDEDEDNEEHTPVSEQPRARSISNFTTSSPKPLIMRLGNHSTPHVARSYERGPSLPIGPASPNKVFASKRPVGNVPSRAPFFNDKKYSKSDQGHGPPVSAFDLYRFTQQHSATTESKSLRPPMSSLQGVRAWQTDQRVQESLRRLDGMLIQHMEAERNTIKRIASSARHTKN